MVTATTTLTSTSTSTSTSISATVAMLQESRENVAPVVELVPNLVYYAILSKEPPPKADTIYFCVDDKLFYNNFYLDFGPLNLGCTFQFCNVMNKMLASARQTNRHIVFYSSSDPHLRTNAVCLLGCWMVLFLDFSPQEAFEPFSGMSFPGFHDATPSVCTYKLTILDCLKGLEKAVQNNYIDPHQFDIQEYHHYEQVENGDLTWVSKKFIAFAGPHDNYSLSPEGYVTLTPQHYIPYFKRNNVSLVVRLNEKLYDETRFTEAGIDHLDLYYPDGSNPPDHILAAFLETCERTPGAVAVHCKAGLGRTGTCIGSYMMKHQRFSAKEVIGWLRLCRPGSVIGPQQQFLESIQQKMWRSGEVLVMVSPCKVKTQEQKSTTNIFTRNIFKRKNELAPISTGTGSSSNLPRTAADGVDNISTSVSASGTSLPKSPTPKTKSTTKTQGDNLVQLKQVHQHYATS